jgi:hypothetical protein
MMRVSSSLSHAAALAAALSTSRRAIFVRRFGESEAHPAYGTKR